MKYKITIKENILAVLIISVIIFTFLYSSGTLLSGYHLVDDHEFYTVGEMLENDGFWRTLQVYIKSDLQIRFRPLYWVERITGVALLGAGTFRWSCIKAVEAVVAVWLLYFFARRKGKSKIRASLFSAICVWGPQTAIWWRLGPQESVGILLLGLCLNTTWCLAQNKNIINRCLFMASLILLSLQKESFMVCVPAFFILLFAFDQSKSIDTKFQQSMKSFIKEYKIEGILIAVSLLLESFVIIWRVGLNQIEYAGFSSQDSVVYYLNGMLQNLTSEGKYPMILVLFILILIYIVGDRSGVDKQILSEICFCTYIWGVQLLVYAKSGMWERYLIPWIISIAYFAVLCAPELAKNNVKAVRCIICSGILFCLINSRQVFNNANMFAVKGHDLRVCVDELVKRTDASLEICGVSDDPEIDYSFGVYMQYKYGYTHYKIGEQNSGDFPVYFGKDDTVEQYFAENNKNADNFDWIITGSYKAAILKTIENTQ